MSLTQKFRQAASDMWQGSWLQQKFHRAGNYVSPTYWLKEAAESLLGDNVVRGLLSLMIAWLDKDKTTTADDSPLLTGLKRWHDKVDSEIAAAAPPQSDAPAEPAPKQGIIPDNIPFIPKRW